MLALNGQLGTSKAWQRSVATLLMLASAWSCWVGEGTLGPDQRMAQLTLVPLLSSPSAVGVADVRSLEIVVTRMDGTVVFTETMEVTSNTVMLAPEVVFTPPSEVFTVEIRLLDANGDLVFAGGPMEVTVGEEAAAEPIGVPMTYVGPGSDAAAVMISPPEATVQVGAIDTFRVRAFRSPVDTVIIALDTVIGPPDSVIVQYVDTVELGVVDTIVVGTDTTFVSTIDTIFVSLADTLVSVDTLVEFTVDTVVVVEEISGTPLKWSSLDPAIASVPDENSGIVQALQPGAARITATTVLLPTGQLSATALLIVLPPSTAP